MTLSIRVLMGFLGINIAIVFVYGAFPGKYKWYNDKKLDNVAFFSKKVLNKVTCVALCNTEFYCGYAEFSTITGDCSLISTSECEVFVDAPQWIVYKGGQVDIGSYLAQNGAVFSTKGEVSSTVLSRAVDGNRYTAFAKYGAGVFWNIDFGDTAWPVSRVHVEYDRYYGMNLKLNVSGVIFQRIWCSTTSRYGVSICRYKPPTIKDGCWLNVASINITKDSNSLTLKLYEVDIWS